MKVKVFCHYVDYPGSEEISLEQTVLFFTTGLINIADIYFYCNYNFSNYDYLRTLYRDFHNVHFIDNQATPEEHELATLSALKDHCDNTDDYYPVLYTHHKGVTWLGSENYNNIRDWRRYMQYFNIERWRDCVIKLNQGYDSVGVNWSGDKHKHWAGNMWWARSDYIRTLPKIQRPKDYGYKHQFFLDDPEHLSKHYRMESELWVGMNNPNVYNFHESYRDHYWFPYPRHEYFS